MNEKIYEELDKGKEDTTGNRVEIKGRSDLRKIYRDFLLDFREHLTEFVKETMIELNISEIPIRTEPTKLFGGEHGGMRIALKNQGPLECYVSTTGAGGFRLDPGERSPEFWLNKAVTVMTLSGNTSIGLIRT